MKFCFNGQLLDSPDKAKVDVTNNTRTSQSSVFETMRTYNSKDIFAVEEHLKRLFRSAEILNISPCTTQEKIRESLYKVVEVNSSPDFDLRIKILLTKNYFWIHTQKLISAPEEIYTKGVEVRSETFERPFPEAKYASPAYLFFIESLQENQFEVIFFDRQGYLREGNISNVFAVFSNTVVTPDERVLHGVTRNKVIELINKDQDLTLNLREIHKKELQKADEIFLTNTTKEIIPIRKWNKWENKNFMVAQKLREEF
ncbi:aminotransferase class IV [Candidatus Gracilibacteria bacterium]|nr:aminotransferase class IV [Candidatus Gracilibacteria bacterium]